MKTLIGRAGIAGGAVMLAISAAAASLPATTAFAEHACQANGGGFTDPGGNGIVFVDANNGGLANGSSPTATAGACVYTGQSAFDGGAVDAGVGSKAGTQVQVPTVGQCEAGIPADPSGASRCADGSKLLEALPGFYAVVEGDSSNSNAIPFNPLSGYVGVSNYDDGHSNDGGGYGLKPLAPLGLDHTPLPLVCGNTSGPWESTSREGCYVP
ncbi:MAG: hypothetical protein JOZ49_10805 [Mycolicibacterium sp.]|nr:hypothetical protein [Mycolicibacterium sp.]